MNSADHSDVTGHTHNIPWCHGAATAFTDVFLVVLAALTCVSAAHSRG